MVYIIQFDRPLGNERHQARYYVGWCRENTLEARLNHHRRGTGAAITRAAAERGIGFEVVLTIPGADRTFERKIKNQKNTARFIERWARQQAAQVH